jgi:hypothetical protein
MKRIYLLVEGQTEETFVREVLAPHYAKARLFMTPILLRTSPGYKGGVTSYGKVKSQLTRLCRQDRGAAVTTIIDLYGLPQDFPGKSRSDFPIAGTGVQKAKFLEARLGQDIGESNFIPYLMVHEFEAMLFSDPARFGDWSDSEDVAKDLERVASGFRTPEDINESPQLAPSKRIMASMPSYEKTFHGPIIAAEIGLDALRRRCAHFAEWLTRLERLVA